MIVEESLENIDDVFAWSIIHTKSGFTVTGLSSPRADVHGLIYHTYRDRFTESSGRCTWLDLSYRDRFTESSGRCTCLDPSYIPWQVYRVLGQMYMAWSIIPWQVYQVLGQMYMAWSIIHTVTGLPSPRADVHGTFMLLPRLLKIIVVPRIGFTLWTVAIFTALSRAFL